ncbi:hypothetical protein ACINWC743_1729 [Acinetobacter sp. WC-743]|nr:hypothetical protein ACINWC743_1729 [Acinetobacter sp. WC-743]
MDKKNYELSFNNTIKKMQVLFVGILSKKNFIFFLKNNY